MIIIIFLMIISIFLNDHYYFLNDHHFFLNDHHNFSRPAMVLSLQALVSTTRYKNIMMMTLMKAMTIWMMMIKMMSAGGTSIYQFKNPPDNLCFHDMMRPTEKGES